jgi:hypothetical protein
MAAGLGFKTFVTGEVLTSGDVNGYLMQGINVFASEAARNAAITSPQEGQFAFTKDTNSTWFYDGAAWVASGASGDVTGVTAGNGISVTSPTGPVPTVAIDTAVTVDKTTAQTLTNKTLTSPALTTPTISTATTNGDLLYGTGSGALQRLGIGSTSQILTVTGGVPAWATPAASGSLPTFSAYKNASTQTFSVSTYTKITFDVENWDDPGCFASSTFTPTSAGYYLITSAAFHQQVGNGDFTLLVYKNGSNWQRLYISNPTSAGVARMDTGSTLVYCNGTTDYIEIYARGDLGGNVSIIEGATLTYFSAIGIRA